MAVVSFDVVVGGGANTDSLVGGPSLPKPGSTVEGGEYQEAPGGKGGKPGRRRGALTSSSNLLRTVR